MIEPRLQDELRPSHDNPRCGAGNRAVALAAPAWSPSVLVSDRGVQHGSFAGTLASGDRTARSRLAPMTVVRRMLAVARSWRGCARSRRELRKLTDHQLKDIGLRRETAGYTFPKALWYCD